MVKNKKKFSAQTFGLIALSLMLVASLVLGISGAWFTSNATDDSAAGSVNMGYVNVTANAGTSVYNYSTKVDGVTKNGLGLPGDTITLTGGFGNASTVEVYAKFSVVLEMKIDGDIVDPADYGITIGGLELVAGDLVDGYTDMYTFGAGEADDYTATITFPNDVAAFNELNKHPATVIEWVATVSIDVIQHGNIGADAAATALGATAEA